MQSLPHRPNHSHRWHHSIPDKPRWEDYFGFPAYHLRLANELHPALSPEFHVRLERNQNRLSKTMGKKGDNSLWFETWLFFNAGAHLHTLSRRTDHTCGLTMTRVNCWLMWLLFKGGGGGVSVSDTRGQNFWKKVNLSFCRSCYIFVGNVLMWFRNVLYEKNMLHVTTGRKKSQW